MKLTRERAVMFDHVIVSFTSALRALVEEGLTIKNIEQSPLLAFGCAREHIFCVDSDRVPMELSWCQSAFLGGLKNYHGRYAPWYGQSPHGTEIPRALIHPDLLIVWEEFKSLILRKEEYDQVRWKIGNYSSFIAAELENGRTCYYQSVVHK